MYTANANSTFCTFTASWGDGVKSRVKCFISNLFTVWVKSISSLLHNYNGKERRTHHRDLNPSLLQRSMKDALFWQFAQAGNKNEGQHRGPEALLGRQLSPVLPSSIAGTQSRRCHRGSRGMAMYLGISQTTNFRADAVYTSWAADRALHLKKYINPQQVWFFFQKSSFTHFTIFCGYCKNYFQIMREDTEN